MTIETTLQVPVKAKLMLKPEYGKEREATKEDLKDLEFLHRRDLYDRTKHIFELVGLDIESDEDHVSLLRYFIEYITQGYDWDPDPEDIERIRALLNP